MERETTGINKASEEVRLTLRNAVNLVGGIAHRPRENLNQEGGAVYLLKRRLLHNLIKARRPYRRMRFA